MSDQKNAVGAVALATSGIAAAFSLAACCALPILLVGTGIGVSWLSPVAQFAETYSIAFTLLAVIALASSVLIVFRRSKTCAPGDLCARPWFKLAIVGLAVAGFTLLILSKLYA